MQKIILVIFSILIFACSSSDNKLKFSDNVDDKSYVMAYQITVQTFGSSVNDRLNIEAYTRGVKDRIYGYLNTPTAKLRSSIEQNLLDIDVYDYRTGAIFLSEVEQRINSLNPNMQCFPMLDKESFAKGIYDALSDMRKNKIRDLNSQYFNQNTEQFILQCRA